VEVDKKASHFALQTTASWRKERRYDAIAVCPEKIKDNRGEEEKHGKKGKCNRKEGHTH